MASPVPKPEPIDPEIDSDYPDSDTEGEQEEEREQVANPSTNIQDDFRAALEAGFAFNGAFAYSHQYPIADAPNPCLKVDGLGFVGCPFSEREGRVVVGEAALRNSAVGTWEVAAEKVHFDNPAWCEWLQGTAAPAALTALGMKTPALTLKKLVIHGPSSKPIVSHDPSHAPTIGSLTVVLPSDFEGATLRFNYADRIATYDLGARSGLSTSIIAAYSGVQRVMESVTSGYRLSLVYDLVHTGATPAPSLPDPSFPADRIRTILRSWTGDAPTHIYYPLNPDTAWTPDFRATLLPDKDAALLDHILPLARSLNLRVRFAQAKVTIRTRVGSTAYQEEVVVREMTDLHGIRYEPAEGELVSKRLARLPAPERPPGSTSTLVDGFTVTTSNHVAILIFPKNRILDRRIVIGDIYDLALNVLRGSTSAAMTSKERKIVRRLLTCCRVRPRDDMLRSVIEAIRACSSRWGDAQPFLDALASCGVHTNLELAGIDALVSAYADFGWAALATFYTNIIANDASNVHRWNFLERLTRLAEEDHDEVLGRWCEEQLYVLFRALGPVDEAQILWLVSVARKHGGSFFQHHVFAVLVQRGMPWRFWANLVSAMYRSMADIAHPDAVRTMITFKLPSMVESMALFRINKGLQPAGTSIEYGNLLYTLHLCISTNNEHHCVRIWQRMRDDATTGKFYPVHPPWQYYLALVPEVDQLLKSTPKEHLDAIFRPFFEQAFVVFIASVCKNPVSAEGRPLCPLDDTSEAALAIAMHRIRSAFLLNQCLIVWGRRIRDIDTLQALARLIRREFPPDRVGDVHEYRTYEGIVTSLANSAIDRNRAYLCSPTIPNPAAEMLRMVEFILDLGVEGSELSCRRLFRRCIDLYEPTTTPKSRVLGSYAPFLHLLSPMLRDRGTDMTVQPFSAFAAWVGSAFARDVMPAKPLNGSASVGAIRAVGVCADCGELQRFLLSENATWASCVFERVPGGLYHLESQLERAAATSLGVRWEMMMPSKLTVTRPASFATISAWATASSQGKALLSDLGGVAMQKAILGADYEAVYERIHGAPVKKPAPFPIPLGDASGALNRKRAAEGEGEGAAAAKKVRVKMEEET
ncbi:hypothetical protein MKEN_00197700 [Mycena kentingensis (nom. inval.)]|nr:hypothetical protein MKEN_00197700 [Mycena kentingensis (nom. inval.)]